MALDFHYYPDVQDNQDNQDNQDIQDVQYIEPPYAPPLRMGNPYVPMAPVSELKARLSAALSRTNTPLTLDEKSALREALVELSKEHVLMDDMYEIPLILSQIEGIPIGKNRGIIGNGGSRTRSYRNKKRGGSRMKRSYRNKKRTLRIRKKRTHRK
jgi:hypothetical protein